MSLIEGTSHGDAISTPREQPPPRRKSVATYVVSAAAALGAVAITLGWCVLLASGAIWLL